MTIATRSRQEQAGQIDYTPKTIAAQMVRDLDELADPKQAAALQRYFTQPVQSLGIDTQTIRSISKAWLDRLIPVWDLADAILLCDELLKRPHVETRGLGFLILAGFHKDFDRTLLARAEHWVRRYLDNWASVDGFVLTILSPLLELYPELANSMETWSKSTCMWLRRAALVALVPFARRGVHLDLSYRLAESSLPEREDLMHKALGWLLREAGKTDPERLKLFLLRHRTAIPRTAVRYAIERFAPPARKELLELTRQAVTPPLRSSTNPRIAEA